MLSLVASYWLKPEHWAEAKCLVCKSPVSGLLSAVVLLSVTWQTSLMKSLKQECSCLSGG